MSDTTVFITVILYKLVLFSLCISLFSKLLLNTPTCRYEAGAERGQNIFGLLSAGPHG